MSVEKWTLSKTERYMYERGHRDARIAAFGAIRRAVEVARGYEHVANTRPYNAAGKAALRYRARSIRYAIRAAIGSDKA